MMLPSFISAFVAGRRPASRNSRSGHKRTRIKTWLELESLESRCTPASFSVLDSFAGAVNVADGGTGSALFVDSASPVAMGTDTTLRTGSATGFIGSANPNQIADSRALTLEWGGPALLNGNSAGVSAGLYWTGDTSNLSW